MGKILVIALFLVQLSIACSINTLEHINTSDINRCSIDGVSAQETEKILLAIDRNMLEVLKSIGTHIEFQQKYLETITALSSKVEELSKEDLNFNKIKVIDIFDKTDSELTNFSKELQEQENAAKKLYEKGIEQFCINKKIVDELGELQSKKPDANLQKTIERLKIKQNKLCMNIKELDKFADIYMKTITLAKDAIYELQNLNRDIRVYHRETCQESSGTQCRYDSQTVLTKPLELRKYIQEDAYKGFLNLQLHIAKNVE